MATFNTAFGALPSVKTLSAQQPRLGVSGGRRRAEDTGDYAGNQQMQAQLQAQLGKTPQGGMGGPAPTFADMQKQGRARPAPGQPAALPGAQPQMVSQLQQMLAKPVTQASPAPTPAPAPAAAPAAVPAAAPAPTGLVAQVASTLGTATYSPQNPPPQNAAEGTTYRDATGRTWTRRTGRWSLEATPGQPTGVTGYANLVPTELFGAEGQGGFSQDGLDMFLQQYGTPETPEEMAQLAANAGMTTQQLQQFMGGRLYSTRQAIAERNEESAFQQQVGLRDPATGYLRERRPDWVVFVPASQGGPGYRAMTFAEHRQRFPNSYAQTESAYQMYLNAQPDFAGAKRFQPGQPAGGDVGGEIPPLEGDIDPLTGQPVGGDGVTSVSVPRPILRPEGESPLQQTGATPVTVPRPVLLPGWTGTTTTGTGATGTGATGTGAAGATGTGASTASGATAVTIPRPVLRPEAEAPLPALAQSNDFLDALRRALGELQAGPTSQEQQAFEAQRQARRAELEAGFGAQRSQLEEELAARGLAASTIGGGRFGDLAGQQARALSTMEADILNRQAELAADRQKTLIAGLQAAGTTQADINYRALQLQQEARLRGRELDIDEARNQAARELGLSTLDVQRDEFLVNLIKALGTDLPPEVLKAIVEKYKLGGAATPGQTPGTPGTPGTPANNPPVNLPPGTRVGELRGWMGNTYRWNGTGWDFYQAGEQL